MTQLFAGEDVGVHDQGDGWRLWCHVGRDVPMLEDFTFTSPAGTAPACLYRPIENRWAFPSSMDPIIRVALRVDAAVTGSADPFDLRILGIMGSLALGIIAAAAILVFPGPLLIRAAVVGLTMVLWLDIGFVTYFTSYYAEVAGLLGGAALIVALAAYVRWPGINSAAAVVGTAVVASMAKPQTLAILAPLVVVILAAPWLGRNGRWAAVASVAVTGILLAGALLYMSLYGSAYAEINAYDTIFSAILVESDDPAATLEAMGLPPSLAPYAGQGYWPENESAVNHPDYHLFLENASRGGTARFIATHPRILAPMMLRTLDSVPTFRPIYLGNFEGRQGVTSRPEPTTWLLGLLRPARLWLPIVWLAAIVGGAWAAWRRRDNTTIRTWGLVAVLAGGAAAILTVTVPFGAGYVELEKHLVFAAWWTAPLLAGGIVLAADGIARWVRIRSGRSPAVPA